MTNKGEEENQIPLSEGEEEEEEEDIEVDSELIIPRKGVYITPAFLLNMLDRLGAMIFIYKLVAYNPHKPTSKDNPKIITSYSDLDNLEDNTIIYREKLTKEDRHDIENPQKTFFFSAILGALYFEGNTHEGYYWELRRPVYNFNEAITHYSMGWELHDLWGDIEALLHSDGSYIVLRNSIILKDFEPPSNSLEAFMILYSKFGKKVFERPLWTHQKHLLFKQEHEYLLEQWDKSEIVAYTRAISHNALSKHLWQHRIQPQKVKDETLDVKIHRLSALPVMPTAIYSIERHNVVWGSFIIAYTYYQDIDFAISNVGLPALSLSSSKKQISFKPYSVFKMRGVREYGLFKPGVGYDRYFWYSIAENLQTRGDIEDFGDISTVPIDRRPIEPQARQPRRSFDEEHSHFTPEESEEPEFPETEPETITLGNNRDAIVITEYYDEPDDRGGDSESDTEQEESDDKEDLVF